MKTPAHRMAQSDPRTTVRASRSILIGLILCGSLLVGSWIWFAFYLRSHSSALASKENLPESDQTFTSQPGPWGELECTRVTIELPDHFIQDETLTLAPTSWFFKDHSREKVIALFKSAGLDSGQIKSLMEKSEWMETDRGIKIVPEEQVVLSLRPESRQKIYSVLEIFPDNEFYYVAFVFRAERLRERFEYSGLHPETIRLFNQMTYPRGSNLVVFADSETLMRQIHDRDERLRLVKTLSRRSTLLVKLKITPETDVEQLLHFWGQGGRAKDLKPLLQSLAKVPGGCKIDIAHLLPPFARQRVYTYPYPSETAESKENCHWTALNFFSDNPDPDFLKSDVVEKVIQEKYQPVTDEWRMGDVIFLVNAKSQLVHSAVYIADDIVFTKNGVNPSHPWVYMKMEDMLLYYETLGEPLEQWIYRNKEFAEQVE
ncbi:MAG: hypothetical protein H0X66_06920 [Verrucomicrobia bacterium]|nr:hypothetical protein [Verrucomicrobiota bacterium]